MLISFQETLENILREQVNKIYFGEQGAWKFRKLFFREEGNMANYFLGNMVPPGRAYLVGLLCTHPGSA